MVASRYKGKTEGLCGTYNGNKSDDFQKPNKKLAKDAYEFGAYWETDKHCIPAEHVTNPCKKAGNSVFQQARKKCMRLREDPFKQCNDRVPVGKATMHNCEYDYCGCNQNHDDCLCEAYQAYAEDCKAAGLNIHWLQDEKLENCSKYPANSWLLFNVMDHMFQNNVIPYITTFVSNLLLHVLQNKKIS